jgi:hypothetical protein
MKRIPGRIQEAEHGALGVNPTACTYGYRNLVAPMINGYLYKRRRLTAHLQDSSIEPSSPPKSIILGAIQHPLKKFKMKATFIIASLFAALAAAAPAAVDTRSSSDVEIEARQVCISRPPSCSCPLLIRVCSVLTDTCRAPLLLAGCATNELRQGQWTDGPVDVALYSDG